MKKILVITMTALGVPAIALAADLGDPLPPELIPSVSEEFSDFTWGGPYLGLHGGAATLTGEFHFCGCGGPLTEKFIGARTGMFLGYNWEFSNGIVTGIEGDINYDWNKKTLAGASNVGTDFSGSVRARVGYSLGNVLVFAAGGWTAANAFVEGPDDRGIADGWTVGSGIDWAVTEQTSFRTEYRYNNFGSANLAGVNSGFDQHAINIGFSVKF